MALAGNLFITGDCDDGALGPVFGNEMGRSAGSGDHNNGGRLTLDGCLDGRDSDGMGGVNWGVNLKQHQSKALPFTQLKQRPKTLPLIHVTTFPRV